MLCRSCRWVKSTDLWYRYSEIDRDQLLEVIAEEVRQICEAGLWQCTMYLPILVFPI